MAPAWLISVGIRAGVGDCQGVEVHWPLFSAQKDTKKITNQLNTSRDGAAQDRVRREHKGKEDRIQETLDANLLGISRYQDTG